MTSHVQEMSQKPHAVCLPFPAQGHINPMLKLAILLHHKGFFITFVNNQHNHRRLLNSRGPNSLNALKHFRFETISDGLPPTDADVTQDIPSLCEATRTNCLAPFRELLVKINNNGCGGDNEMVVPPPPVSCVVSDAIMSFGVVAAKEIGVPSVSFRTTNSRGFMCNKHLRLLIEKGFLPLKDANDLTNGYLETSLDWIPTLENIRLKDFPTFIRTTNINDSMLNFVIQQTEKSSESSAIIFNTFDALENNVLNGLKSMCPPIYTIGPIHLLSKKISENSSKFIGSNLWKEEPECLQWLDSKEDKSVVYVNFGSITVITRQQLVEFAWGLANSKKDFLCIIRSDSVVGDDDDSTTLPSEFLEEIKGRGLISRWCPQEQVLKHRAIGVFLTHCGWNSMIESLACGVPMICWPFFADQQLNCRCACMEWGVGMEIDGNVDRVEVEKLVREVIDGDEGKKMREKAIEWKGKAEAAVEEDGSSYLNLDKVVNEIILSKAA